MAKHSILVSKLRKRGFWTQKCSFPLHLNQSQGEIPNIHSRSKCMQMQPDSLNTQEASLSHEGSRIKYIAGTCPPPRLLHAPLASFSSQSRGWHCFKTDSFKPAAAITLTLTREMILGGCGEWKNQLPKFIRLLSFLSSLFVSKLLIKSVFQSL